MARKYSKALRAQAYVEQSKDFEIDDLIHWSEEMKSWPAAV